jgi:HlyD family secretion protein
VKPIRLVLVAVAVLVLGGTVAVLLRRDGDARDEILASGTVEATTADVGFALGGRLLVVHVREGDRVQAGQELARLESSELEARRSAAEAQVAGAEAALAELVSGPRPQEIAHARAALAAAEERHRDAVRDADRLRRLYAGGAVSREALDKAETQLAVLAAQVTQAQEQLETLVRGTRTERLAAARAQLQQARAQLGQVEAQLANARVSAPWSGLVTVRHREPGEAVPAGAPVVTVTDLEDRWVRIYVPEADVARIAEGQDARISADGYPDRSYEGSVIHIASEAEFTPRNVQTPEERTKLVYAVKVRVTRDAEHHLKPGLPVDVLLTPRPGGG